MFIKLIIQLNNIYFNKNKKNRAKKKKKTSIHQGHIAIGLYMYSVYTII